MAEGEGSHGKLQNLSRRSSQPVRRLNAEKAFPLKVSAIPAFYRSGSMAEISPFEH